MSISKSQGKNFYWHGQRRFEKINPGFEYGWTKKMLSQLLFQIKGSHRIYNQLKFSNVTLGNEQFVLCNNVHHFYGVASCSSLLKTIILRIFVKEKFDFRRRSLEVYRYFPEQRSSHHNNLQSSHSSDELFRQATFGLFFLRRK